MIKSQKTVSKKRQEFMESLEWFNLPKEVLKNIEELADSMETANKLGEKHLAKAFKDEIKRVLQREIKGSR